MYMSAHAISLEPSAVARYRCSKAVRVARDSREIIVGGLGWGEEKCARQGGVRFDLIPRQA